MSTDARGAYEPLPTRSACCHAPVLPDPDRAAQGRFPLGRLYLLDTPGRRTGALRTVPIVIFRHDGRRWLVSIFGETGWVANIRAAGTAPLRRGRPGETIRCPEDTDRRRDERAMQLRRPLSPRVHPHV